MIFLAFNFNKCCIWINDNSEAHGNLINLTLTSVVFELIKLHTSIRCNIYLTLTSVVFEWIEETKSDIAGTEFNFNKCCIWISHFITLYILFVLFNFNKCCIWIYLVLVLYMGLNWFNFNKCCIWIRWLSSMSPVPAI